MRTVEDLKYTVKRLTNPSEQEITASINALNKAFNEELFLPIQNGSKELSKDLIITNITSAIQFGELWVAELSSSPSSPSSSSSESDGGALKSDIIGVACWYGRGQLMPRGEDGSNTPWAMSMLKLDKGQPLQEYKGSLQSAGRIWWDKFYEAFDALASTALGPTGRKSAYHLQLLGVHPAYQRKGVGTALDKAVTESVRESASKDSSTIMCLEALDAENVSVYQKMGYTIKSKAMVPSVESGETLILPFVCMAKTV